MPNNKTVQQHLEDLQLFDGHNYIIVEALRQIIFNKFPLVNEIVKYNGLMYANEQSFGGIFTYKNHVSLEFGNGYLMKDKDKILQGSGKFRRHLKFESIDDITAINVDYFLDQVNHL